VDYRLIQTVEPASEPVTLAEAKTHLRVSDDTEDTYISGLITAARRYAEEITQRQIVSATWQMKLIYFWSGDLWIPRPPLQSITSITYVDVDGVTQTLSSSIYTVDKGGKIGRVYLAYDQTWPTIRSRTDEIIITYVAGASVVNVPATMKHAIKLIVAHWFESREPVSIGNTVTPIPMAAESLLWQERVEV